MKFRILVVCSANVCRSKMFETLLINELTKQDVTGVSVESAGLMRICDTLTVSDEVQEVLREIGLVVVEPRSRHIGKIDDNTPFDAVFCMDQRQKEILVQDYRFGSTIVHVLNEADGGVFDPTSLDPTLTSDFEWHRNCRELLIGCARTVVRQLDQYLPNWAPCAGAPAIPTLPS